MVVDGGRGQFDLELPLDEWFHVASWLRGLDDELAVCVLRQLWDEKNQDHAAARLSLPDTCRAALDEWLAGQGLQLRATRDSVALRIVGIEPPPTQALSYLAVLVRTPEQVTTSDRILDVLPRRQVRLDVGAPVTRWRGERPASPEERLAAENDRVADEVAHRGRFRRRLRRGWRVVRGALSRPWW